LFIFNNMRFIFGQFSRWDRAAESFGGVGVGFLANFGCESGALMAPNSTQVNNLGFFDNSGKD